MAAAKKYLTPNCLLPADTQGINIVQILDLPLLHARNFLQLPQRILDTCSSQMEGSITASLESSVKLYAKCLLILDSNSAAPYQWTPGCSERGRITQGESLQHQNTTSVNFKDWGCKSASICDRVSVLSRFLPIHNCRRLLCKTCIPTPTLLVMVPSLVSISVGAKLHLADYFPSTASAFRPSRFVATAWSGASPAQSGIRIYYSSPAFDGIREIVSPGCAWSAEGSSYHPGYFFDSKRFGIMPECAFAVTSLESGGDLEDLRLFYWSSNQDRLEIQDICWIGLDWKRPSGNDCPCLTLHVQAPDTSQLAAVAWSLNQVPFWSVFYIENGYLNEAARHGTASNWARTMSKSHKLDYIIKVGELKAIAWVEEGLVYKVIYVLDSVSHKLYEICWEGGDVQSTWKVIRGQVQAFSICSARTWGYPSIRLYIQLVGSRTVIEVWPSGVSGRNIEWAMDKLAFQRLMVEKGAQPQSLLGEAFQPGDQQGWVSFFHTDSVGGLMESHRGPNGCWSESTPVVVSPT